MFFTEIIAFLLIGIILGYLNAIFVFFIDFCFNEGNIFDWYYLLLLKYVEPKYPKLSKPLGLCPICMGFWVGLGVFTLFALLLTIPAWVFFPFIAVSSYKLMKIFKVNQNE
jgi:hypothetical protein